MKDPYGFISKMYDPLIEPFLRTLRVRTVEILLERMDAPEEKIRVLDLACGTGSQVELFEREGFNTIGLDLSGGMLARAKKKAQRKRNADFDLVQADACNLPFMSSVFHAVSIMFALHEMDRKMLPGVLQEMKRVAKPDALFLVIDFSKRPAFNRFTPLIRLAELSAGLRHYRNGRDFVRSGGAPFWLKRAGYGISDTYSSFSAHICLTVAHTLRK